MPPFSKSSPSSDCFIHLFFFSVRIFKLPVDTRNQPLGENRHGFNVHFSVSNKHRHGTVVHIYELYVAETIYGFGSPKGGILEFFVGQNNNRLVFPAQPKSKAGAAARAAPQYEVSQLYQKFEFRISPPSFIFTVSVYHGTSPTARREFCPPHKSRYSLLILCFRMYYNTNKKRDDFGQEDSR